MTTEHSISPAEAAPACRVASPSARAPRKPLRLWPISDLHLARGEGWATGHIPEADVAVVAGDVCEGVVTAVEWLAAHIRPHMRVVYVPGNHEFYGTALNHALMMGQDAAAKAGIDLLDGEAIVIDGVRFVGATLWTDYLLFGERMRWAAMAQARASMNDHRHVAWSKLPWRRFKPDDAATLHLRSVLEIERHLVHQHRAGPTVVVTHHAPHIESIAPRLRSELLSAAYASDLSDLISRVGPALWVHGHTHHAIDAEIHGMRLLSNPRGYRSESSSIGWQPLLTVEV
jgi:Icc-related predicted phosphoesterase